MEKEQDKQESSCLPLTSIDLLDSRAEQERGAEIVEQTVAKILRGCVTYVPASIIGALELRVARYLRGAIEDEREICAQIAETSGIYGHTVSNATAKNIADKIRARKT